MLLAKTFLVTGILAAAALASPRGATEPQRAPERPPALQRLVRQLVRDGAPGALMVVRTRSGISRAQSGLARRYPRVPMAARDRFRVASITKSFVATVVLQLVAEGKMGLDDPVDRWLPGLVPNGRAITIRKLLGHTSGLYDYGDDPAFSRAVIAHPARPWPPRKLVALAASHPRLFPPGSDWSYSNTNYILLGLVVEAVTGTTVGEQLEQRVFAPLALTSTTFPTTPKIDGVHAHGYIGFATLPRLRSLLDVTSVVTPSTGWSAGAVVSNGDDVTALYAALLGGRLLPANLLRAMETPVTRSAPYGLGLFVVDTRCGRAYGHVGIAAGYRTVVYGRPGGTRVAAVMVNVDNTYVAQSELDSSAETALCSG
jgi:D-alanyl-D-alanine carboxypeptidase